MLIRHGNREPATADPGVLAAVLAWVFAARFSSNNHDEAAVTIANPSPFEMVER